MKIAQIITRGDVYYGAQAHFHDVCRLLNEDSQNVVAITGSTGILTERLEADGIEFVVVPSLNRSINPLHDWKCLSDLQELFSLNAPDIVAAHSSKAGILARMACRRAGIPCVFTAHGWSFEDGIPWLHRNLYRSIERHVGKYTDRIIAVAEKGRQLGIENRVAPPERISTVHYGVADIGGGHVHKSQPIFTMTMVAEFRRQKDHATLIAALRLLRDRPWRINLLGGGDLMPQIKEQVKAFGLEDRVNFAGAVNNVHEYLSATDLMVLITNWEGLPISILEGLSFSLPMVASDVSGISEEVIDGYNGLLVQRGNADDVAKAIAAIMDDPQKLDEFGANSRKLFEDQFTQQAMYGKLRALYEDVIAEHQASHSVAL